MSVILVEGGKKLSGALTVQGAKNSVLPMLAATIVHPGRTVLRGGPRLTDAPNSATWKRRRRSFGVWAAKSTGKGRIWWWIPGISVPVRYRGSLCAGCVHR